MLRYLLPLVLLCCFTPQFSFAQNPQQIGCIDPAIRQQAITLKEKYAAQGFETMRDGMLGMQSEMAFPVVVNLKKGVFYQIIFISNARASKLSVESYNGNDEKIDTHSSKVKDGEPNYVSFSFMPDKTDAYLFMLMQKMKSKKICGAFVIMQLKNDKTSPAPENK